MFLKPLKNLIRFTAASGTLHLAFILLLFVYVFYYLLAVELRVVGKIGFTMDDVWIHMTVARNFVEGDGWGVVRGRWVSVSTSPVWALLLAVFYFFLRDPVVTILSVSFACGAAALSLCYLVTTRLTERPILGLIAAVVVMLHPTPLWGWVSGMELPGVILALFLLLYLYYSWDPESKMRRFAVPVALAFAAMTRPELFVLIPIALLDTFRAIWVKGTREARYLAVRTFLIQGVVVLLALAPYFAFNKAVSSLWFPTTYYAKTRVRGVGLSAALHARDWGATYRSLVPYPINQVLEVANLLTNSNLIMMLFLVPGALGFCRMFGTKATARGGLLVAAMFILPYAMGVTAPVRLLSNHANRHYVLFPVMGAVLSAVGLDLLVRIGRQRLLACICAFFLVMAPWRNAYNAVKLLAMDVDSTERMYRQLAEWMKSNLDPEAVLAVNDIGVIAYIADRDIIDIMGLATPEIWSAIQRRPGEKLNIPALRTYLQEHKVEYLLVAPHYYPALTSDSAVFKPLMRWEEKYERGRRISPQVLYKCEWPAAGDAGKSR